MATRGESGRPSLWRVTIMSLSVVALVLWFWAGRTWWVAVPLVGGLFVASLVIKLVPERLKDGTSGLAGAAVALGVIVWLLTFTPPLALGVAFGAGGLVCVAQLRAVLPHWAQWTALGVSAGLAVTCGLVTWLSWRADQQRQEAAERAEHEYRVAEMRPEQPLGMFHLVVKAIHDNDPALVCFVFSPEGERAFAAAAGLTTCPDAITALHGQITGKGYGNTTVDPDEITRETAERPATVSGCRAYIVDGPLQYRDSPGPELGTFRLERDPRFPSSGYLITNYTPCAEIDPDMPPTTATTPPVLPSYPPGLPGMLAQAITANDDDVCTYFTEQGAKDFAATVDTTTCADAIEALHGQVTDPNAYLNPDGETISTTSAGTEVNACGLTWNRYGQGATVAGPQLGNFTLIRPAGYATGYMINAVRACP